LLAPRKNENLPGHAMCSALYYPINFVVKHPNLFVCFRKGPPWGGENLPDFSGLFPDRRHMQ